MRNENGFSFVELLTVIVIIGALAGIAIAKYDGAHARGHDAKVIAAVRSLATAEEAYFATHGEYAEDLSDLPEVSLDDLSVIFGAGNSGSTFTSFRVTVTEEAANRAYTWTSDPAPGEPSLTYRLSGAGTVGN